VSQERITILDAADCNCLDDHPHLDEFVLYDIASIHFEAMGGPQFWMSIHMNDGREFDVNCGGVNPRPRVTHGSRRTHEKTHPGLAHLSRRADALRGRL
jgi:hypothetical protein